MLTLAVLVSVPVGTTLILGGSPYEDIVRVYPGEMVSLAATVLLLAADTAGLVSVGALVVLLFLRDGTAEQVRLLQPCFELAVLQRAAGIWVLSSTGLMLFDPLDTAGVGLGQLLVPGVIEYVQSAAYAPGAVVARLVGASVVALASHFARSWTGLLFPLLAAVWAVLAPVVVGHVLVGPGHDFGSDVAIVQMFATCSLFGVVAVLALGAWSGRPITAGMLGRVTLLGVIAVPIIIVTDLVLTWFLLAGTPLLGSLSGWFILVRWICLALLVVAGVFLIRGVPNRGGWLSGPLGKRQTFAAISLAAISVAGWTGVSVSMSRVPTPQYFVPTSISQILMGFDVDAAPTALVLFTHWRPNLLVLAIAVAAVAAYLVALRAARRRDVAWPFGRTAAWLLGWGLTTVATSSGLGKYSASHFGVHMIVHMTLSMMAPVFLVLGGFLTLMLRASRADSKSQHGLHQWITWLLSWRVMRLLYSPLVVFAVFIGSYYTLYMSDLFETMVRYHWAHQLMNIHFLLVGYLYYGLIVGVDRAPKPLPHLGRLGLVLAAMPFHAFFGVIVMSSNSIIAANFYRYLDLPWMNLPAAQELGGGVAWAGGEIPALIVIIVLGLQWAKQDAKDARRIDRHIDSGRDQEFDEYNRMLQRLSQRDTLAPGTRNEEIEK